jgi:hypothetical protein
MDGYMLYRKDGRTALVLLCEDDDELYYTVSKLHRSRNKGMKEFAQRLLEQYFLESSE